MLPDFSKSGTAHQSRIDIRPFTDPIPTALPKITLLPGVPAQIEYAFTDRGNKDDWIFNINECLNLKGWICITRLGLWELCGNESNWCHAQY